MSHPQTLPSASSTRHPLEGLVPPPPSDGGGDDAALHRQAIMFLLQTFDIRRLTSCSQRAEVDEVSILHRPLTGQVLHLTPASSRA